jgi:hypothetical protein
MLTLLCLDAKRAAKTDLEIASAVLSVTTEETKRHELWPDHEILRIVECVEGSVPAGAECGGRSFAQTIMRTDHFALD